MDLGDDWKLQATNVCFGAKNDINSCRDTFKLKLQHRGKEQIRNLNENRPNLILEELPNQNDGTCCIDVIVLNIFYIFIFRHVRSYPLKYMILSKGKIYLCFCEKGYL